MKLKSRASRILYDNLPGIKTALVALRLSVLLADSAGRSKNVFKRDSDEEKTRRLIIAGIAAIETLVQETDDYQAYRQQPEGFQGDVGTHLFIGGTADGVMMAIDRRLDPIDMPVRESFPNYSRMDESIDPLHPVNFEVHRYFRMQFEADQRSFFLYVFEELNADEVLRRLIGLYPRGLEFDRRLRENWEKQRYGYLDRPLIDLRAGVEMANTREDAIALLLDFIGDREVTNTFALKTNTMEKIAPL